MWGVIVSGLVYTFVWGFYVTGSGFNFDGGFIDEFIYRGFFGSGFTFDAALRLQSRGGWHRVPLGTPGECVGQRAMP